MSTPDLSSISAAVVYDPNGWPSSRTGGLYVGEHLATFECSGAPRLAEDIARACGAHAAMLSALKDVEWSGEIDREEGGFEPGCPQCGATRRDGHLPACALSAAIAKAEGRS